MIVVFILGLNASDGNDEFIVICLITTAIAIPILNNSTNCLYDTTTSSIRGVGRRQLLLRRGLPERRRRADARLLHPVQPALERSSVRGRCAHALGRARRRAFAGAGRRRVRRPAPPLRPLGRRRSYLLAQMVAALRLVIACFAAGRCHATVVRKPGRLLTNILFTDCSQEVI